MTFTHFILTRYALRIDGKPPKQPKWYNHRKRVFEQFCLSSILKQSQPNFVWLVFTHPDDRDVMNVLDDARRHCRQLVIVPTTEPWDNFNDTMRAACLAHLIPGSTHIITTRLDNDDAIASDFVALVQSKFEGLPERRFVNFDVGQNYDTQSGRTIPHPHPCNMFISCIEPLDQFRGVLTWEHNSTEGIAHVIRIAEPGRWTHVVHPYNEYQGG